MVLARPAPGGVRMRRTLVLTERKPRRVRLAPADVEFLLAAHAGRIDLAPTGRRGVYRLTPRGVAGVVAAPTRRLVIRPKIPLQNLFFLLDPDDPAPASRDETAPTPRPDLLDFLAGRLARLLAERSAAGPAPRLPRSGPRKGRSCTAASTWRPSCGKAPAARTGCTACATTSPPTCPATGRPRRRPNGCWRRRCWAIRCATPWRRRCAASRRWRAARRRRRCSRRPRRIGWRRATGRCWTCAGCWPTRWGRATRRGRRRAPPSCWTWSASSSAYVTRGVLEAFAGGAGGGARRRTWSRPAWRCGRT